MDFELADLAHPMRDTVRDWIDHHPTPTFKELAEAGYVAPHWPAPYGVDADPIEQLVIDQELKAAGIQRPKNAIGIGWAGPTIMHAGTEEQMARYLPPMLSGEEIWCQMFSEPDAGSDLAALSTRAERDGDEYVINGSKIWTSGGHQSAFGILLARTNPDVSKHRGISYFICPTDLPGLTMTPVIDMTTAHSFNQVFFDDVRLPASYRIGDEGDGWRLAKVTLSNERVQLSASGSLWGAGPSAGQLLDCVRQSGGVSNPVLRQQLAKLHCDAEVLRLNRLRTLSSRLAGRTPGPEASIQKIMADEHGQQSESPDGSRRSGFACLVVEFAWEQRPPDELDRDPQQARPGIEQQGYEQRNTETWKQNPGYRSFSPGRDKAKHDDKQQESKRHDPVALTLSGCGIFGGSDGTELSANEDLEPQSTVTTVQPVPAGDSTTDGTGGTDGTGETAEDGTAAPAGAALPTAVTLPTAAPTPEPTVDRSQPSTYIVQSGDVLGVIAERFDADIAELRRVNGLDWQPHSTDESAAPAEQATSAPSGPAATSAPVSCGSTATGHCVQPGESLLGIALKYDVTVEALRAANAGISGDLIKSGEVLNLPGTTTTTDPDPAPAATAVPVAGSTPLPEVTVGPANDADCAARNPEFPYYHAADGLCYANPIDGDGSGSPTPIPTVAGGDLDQDCPRRLLLVGRRTVLPNPGLVTRLNQSGYVDSATGEAVGFLDALYYASVTVTTTGYGDITAVSSGARLATIFLITPARIVFLILVVGTTVEVLTDQSREFLASRRWRRRVRDHIVICGFGATGQSAASELLNRGESPDDIVVVDTDSQALAAAEELGFVSIVGNATQSAVLEQAGVPIARAVIVAPNRDDTAVLITLTVRELTTTAHIVAGGREQENLHLLRQGGADEVIDATAAVGKMLGMATTAPGAVKVIDDLLDAGNGLELYETAPVGATGQASVPAGCTVVAVLRDGKRGSTLQKHYAGFDIGGTKTLAVVVSEDGDILFERRVPRPHGPEETVDQLCTLVQQVQAEVGVTIDAVGIGIAGAISRSGSVQFSPNIPELVDFPLRDLLAVNIPTVVDNDATAATWAEHQLGAGQGVDDLLYVALGTGIGTGFVLDGQIYRGAHGFAGESGHIVIDRHGDTHISGVKGPWEMYASGSGLGAMGREWAERGDLASVAATVDDVASIRGEHVGEAIAAGHQDALALLDVFASHVAVGMTNLMYVLDPARIVLGGGLVELRYGNGFSARSMRPRSAAPIGHTYP
ncbi:Acyl-CoA dehydrogenase FadE34 [Nymphon striatum]|nr:Acyl-CoA dehydrogenase FadE34 [Nymphon striatum]